MAEKGPENPEIIIIGPFWASTQEFELERAIKRDAAMHFLRVGPRDYDPPGKVMGSRLSWAIFAAGLVIGFILGSLAVL